MKKLSVLLFCFVCANVSVAQVKLVSQSLINICNAKGDVTAYAYAHRPKMNEEQMLKVLEESWFGTWIKLDQVKHSTYIDMQRIIRDAYRTNNKGEFRNECCTMEVTVEQVRREMEECFWYEF